MRRLPPRSTRTDTLVHYTTRFRSPAHAFLDHRYAKQAVHAAHCDRVVGDDQIAGAGIADHLIEQIAEALDIGVIKWRINFVENADRGGVGEEQPEYERDGSQGLLAA